MVTVHIELAWWLMPYTRVLLFFCGLMQREPDWNKFERMLSRAIRLKVVEECKPDVCGTA